MNRVGEFSKVSLEQFLDACNGVQFEYPPDEVYENIPIPKRATSGSAGYDFKAPFAFDLNPGWSIKIPTGIRVKIEDGWYLACFPRSGMGFKYQVRLANTCGVIDSDYFYSDNEGHIMLKLVNGGNDYVHVNAGDGIAQGIFMQYGITYDDNAVEKRNGGFGSTDRK